MCIGKSCVTFCFIALNFGLGLAQLKPGQRNDSRQLYYHDRRWFIRNNYFKYILYWTSSKMEPFYVEGTDAFMKANCSFVNCIVTSNKEHFNDLRHFNAIFFDGPAFYYRPSLLDNLPKVRSRKQMYIFHSDESAHYYPICDDEVDDFFNMTWTYKLNSDLPSPYLIVRDRTGEIIGPKQTMDWRKVESMFPIDINIKNKLKNKSEAVAWLVSICATASEREIFVEQLKIALAGYMLTVDIFGKCGDVFRCGRPELVLPDCWELIENEYYFYLSFENSFDEDYVTEKLLNPLQHYTVPIVYGGANYTRFLPDGTYLNAKDLGVKKLAKEISDIINDKERYYSFFKWHNHYSYHSPTSGPESNPFCALCEMLNKPTYRTYPKFREWWNVPGACPKEAVPQPVPTKDVLFI